MIGAVRREHRRELVVAHDLVGLTESERIDVESARHVQIGVPQREMPEPARLEGPRQQAAANVVHTVCSGHGRPLRGSPAAIIRRQ